MILTFTDLHLGLKHQSKQEEIGLYTSEVEAYKCLNYIYHYCKDKNNNIDLVIFKGDWFHNNTPASIHYKNTINWLTKFNELEIDLILIPGNHSSSIYSNCLSFIHELNLKHINLVDSLDNDFVYRWQNYHIYFVPYKYSESMKERDINVENEFNKKISNITTTNNIIVSHVNELSAKIGSESLMIAKGVELIDIDNISNIDLVLLGHIHRHQIYHKNGVKVVFTGAPYYQDKSDVNQQKGFCVIKDIENITFINIPIIRKYHKLNINKSILDNIDTIFQNRKLTKQDVIYFDCHELERDINIEELLQQKCIDYNFLYGGCSYIEENTLENNSIELSNEDNPKEIFKEWVNQQELESTILDLLYDKGINYIETFYKV